VLTGTGPFYSARPRPEAESATDRPQQQPWLAGFYASKPPVFLSENEHVGVMGKNLNQMANGGKQRQRGTQRRTKKATSEVLVGASGLTVRSDPLASPPVPLVFLGSPVCPPVLPRVSLPIPLCVLRPQKRVARCPAAVVPPPLHIVVPPCSHS
jgi:hypothetical protein